MILDAFMSSGGPAAAALLLFRFTGLLAVAPLFSARAVPLRIKAALTALLVLLVLPAAVGKAGPDLQVSPEMIVAEFAVGFTLGFAAGVIVHGAEIAGDFVAVQTGLSGANLLDPLSETQMPVLGQFLGLTMTAAFLTIGGHRVVLDAAAHSLDVVPQGAGLRPEGLVPLVNIGGQLFVLGLQLAAPVIAAITIGNVALGVLARTVPQLNVLLTAFPLQIGIGLLVLATSLPILGYLILGWPAEFQNLSDGILLQLAPDPGGGNE
jgi:flagellar biosynthesis protein FliR